MPLTLALQTAPNMQTEPAQDDNSASGSGAARANLATEGSQGCGHHRTCAIPKAKREGGNHLLLHDKKQNRSREMPRTTNRDDETPAAKCG